MFFTLYVCTFVFCLLAGLRKNYSIDCNKIQWEDDTRSTEETVGYWW